MAKSQDCAGDTFARDVAGPQSEPLPAQVQEVVTAASDLAGLDADAIVLQVRESGSVCGKSANTPPQIGGVSAAARSLDLRTGCPPYLMRFRRGVQVNGTPRSLHSWKGASASETNTVVRPIKWCCGEPGSAHSLLEPGVEPELVDVEPETPG